VSLHDETIALHAGYEPGNTEPMNVPIVQSTTYVYDSSEAISEVFDEPTKSLIYSRFANPTVMAVEAKIAALEGGVAAMATSSGQAATLAAVLNLCERGDHLISTGQIYGGTTNLFAVTLARMGIEVSFVDAGATREELDALVRPTTKLVFGETLANPALTVLDIEKFANFAHAHGLPLVVDNTFPTPVLCKPISWGADIVIHSTSKYMDGHAVQVGGIVVDSGRFDWAAHADRFPALSTPDESYHGTVYTETYGAAAYIVKARMQLMRDFGTYPAAHSAFMLDLGLQTLALRMERHSANALAVAEYLAAQTGVVSRVIYPGLAGDAGYDAAQKYFKNGMASGVVSLVLAGGREVAPTFMDSLQLVNNAVHVADVRTMVLHPASTTHRQCTDEQLAAAGVDPGLVRLSVGIEHVDDILEDLENGIKAIS
jgi:O-acetylhomoserine (thiol)-lyase